MTESTEMMAAQLAAVDKVLREFEGMTGSGYRYIAANIRSAITKAAVDEGPRYTITDKGREMLGKGK